MSKVWNWLHLAALLMCCIKSSVADEHDHLVSRFKIFVVIYFFLIFEIHVFSLF